MSTVSDEHLLSVMFAYTKVLSPSAQIIAIFANVLNVITFCKIGLRDGVNITFLILSISDLVYVALDACKGIASVIALSPWQKDLPVSMITIGVIIQFYQYIFLDASTCVETYLAITRCCCVAMPLKFKNIFTFQRTVLINAVILMCNTVFRIPLLSSYYLTWQTNPFTNLTKLTFYPYSHFQILNFIELVVARTVCPVVFLFISTVCSLILARSLIQASLNRKRMTHVTGYHGDVNKGNDHALKAKEVQLVKAVTLVIILLGFLQLVLSLFSLAQAAMPEFFPGRKYNNLHGIITFVVNHLIILHCAYKIGIYYLFNTRFRAIVKMLFHVHM
ncbi:5-hydroxytryptamine receptor 2 [Biomphalaria pfeifferi]|uniref:5-hydroxytryptamine receptor 2 n=1 Tax=Biomphalaria pfeifferi TaxID=112525 RepID=A0AAD8FIV9_BIOPF|nr:5-hydroxytryptamine receptor 2 [Biomphalaria pfeifferi]